MNNFFFMSFNLRKIINYELHLVTDFVFIYSRIGLECWV